MAIGKYVLDVREVDQFFTGPELSGQREVRALYFTSYVLSG